MASKLWEPGNSAYKDFLDNLTTEERIEHLAKRKAKSTMKKAMDSIIAQQQDKWIAELNSAAIVMLNQAKEKGDVQAFIAIWDRLIGKPTNEVKIDVASPLPWNDNFDEDD